jgi:DNA-binding phage protein
MLFVGAAFVVGAILWIASDARKGRKFMEQAEMEKTELLSIIDDAELMVNELNIFSDYIFSRIDSKNSEAEAYIEKLGASLDSAKRMDEMASEAGLSLGGAGRALVREELAEEAGEPVPQGAEPPACGQEEAAGEHASRDGRTSAPIIMFPSPEDIEKHRARRKIRRSYSKKCAEVLRCAEDGLGEAEIAQRLDIGKGEVSLILGLKDAYEEH